MNMKRKLPHAVFAALLIGLLASSCNDNYGIFASIQQEKKGAVQGPFFRASVGEVFSFQNKIWARRATIMQSSDGTTGWISVGVAGLTSYTCTSMAATSTTLYAVLANKGLYSTTDGTTWSLVAGSAPSGNAIIEAVFSANDTVFAVKHDDGGTPLTTADDVWSLLSGPTLASTNLSVTGSPIIGIVWDGTAYWAAAASGLYSASAASGTYAAQAITGLSAGGILSSIAVGPISHNLYIGTAGSQVYARLGGTWLSPSAVLVSATSPTYCSVSALTEFSAGSSTYIIAGLGGTATGASGYYELGVGSSALSTPILGSDAAALLSAGGTAGTTNYDTTLYLKPINSFYYDANAKRLYASVAAAGITGASGLYYNVYNGSTWSGWTAE
jgi:hypothetical protein